MTLMDFSRKYRIPHRIAYEASYKVQPSRTLCAYMEYPENELVEEVRNLLMMRKKKYQRFIDTYDGYIANIQGR